MCHDVVEIMAPLKHDCLFPLTTPTCQWVGHAAPETDYDFSFASVCVCVCARVYWAVIEDVMQHRDTRTRLQRWVECAISVSICSKSKTREREFGEVLGYLFPRILRNAWLGSKEGWKRIRLGFLFLFFGNGMIGHDNSS